MVEPQVLVKVGEALDLDLLSGKATARLAWRSLRWWSGWRRICGDSTAGRLIRYRLYIDITHASNPRLERGTRAADLLHEEWRALAARSHATGYQAIPLWVRKM